MAGGLTPRFFKGVATATGVCQECASVLDESGLLSSCGADRAQELKSN
jgi:hypothetical protein